MMPKMKMATSTDFEAQDLSGIALSESNGGKRKQSGQQKMAPMNETKTSSCEEPAHAAKHETSTVAARKRFFSSLTFGLHRVQMRGEKVLVRRTASLAVYNISGLTSIYHFEWRRYPAPGSVEPDRAEAARRIGLRLRKGTRGLGQICRFEADLS